MLMRKVRPRLVELEKQSLLVVFNVTPKDQSATLKLPPRYTKAPDLHSRAARVAVDHSVSLTVPYQDAVVLRLESQTAPAGGGWLGNRWAMVGHRTSLRFQEGGITLRSWSRTDDVLLVIGLI